jgi:hypothetical protein
VIRHEVNDLAEPRRMQRGHERIIVLTRADLRVQFVVIADVIAVQAPRAGAEKRRRIDMADAQITQIGHQITSLQEGEVLVELKAVRRGGDV